MRTLVVIEIPQVVGMIIMLVITMISRRAASGRHAANRYSSHLNINFYYIIHTSINGVLKHLKRGTTKIILEILK